MQYYHSDWIQKVSESSSSIYQSLYWLFFHFCFSTRCRTTVKTLFFHHPSISSTLIDQRKFFVQIFDKKFVRKTLMKLTSGVNFINVLCTAFTLVDPKSVKRYWQLYWVFTLLGSTSAKVVHRTLMKVIPGVDFTNIFTRSFYMLNFFTFGIYGCKSYV